MQLPSFPDLTKFTAWSEKEIYTVNQIQELIEYGKTFGIEVIPEFDLPAHAMGFSHYPDLSSLVLCTDKQWHYTYPDGGRISGGPNTGALNPADDKTYQFIENLYKDISSIFPSDKIHFGGDEVILSCWKNNAQIDEYMLKNNLKTTQELFNHFIQKAYTTVRKVTQKTLMYWVDEYSTYIDYPKDQILQYWGDTSKVGDFIA